MATATRPGPAPALDVPDDCEVVYGHIYEVEPMGAYAVSVAGALNRKLGAYLDREPVGTHYPVMGYRIPQPDDATRVRIPDLSFVSFDRWPADRPIPVSGKPMDAVPDLAVEVVSPTDSFEDVVDKAGEYLRAGCRLVWVLLPRARSVYVYTGAGAPTVLTAADTLTGGDVLPGFAVRVGDLFPPGVPA